MSAAPAGTPRERSMRVNTRLHEVVPGGAHTYAKGDDQYPADWAPVIARGLGARVWDLDGNEYVEYGSGLRSVVLGHAHPAVVSAAQFQLGMGCNFARPSVVELTAAETFLSCVPGADMVKFAKNGSDATTAAVRLARAITGRPFVAICRDQPFFSVDDWFIATTAMPAGIPDPIGELTVSFPYGDIDAVRSVFAAHPDSISCVVLEARTQDEPPPGYLEALRDVVHDNGALLVFDEMINGFRLSEAGAQGMYGVVPDLSTFGKAMGNGFAVSALAGKRQFMERGGLHHCDERVFLLSTTHGAETHSLAAAVAVMNAFGKEGVAQRLTRLGSLLADGVRRIVHDHGLDDHIVLRGHPSNLVYATRDADGNPSQEYRTLFLRQLLSRGVLAPSFVVSAALTERDLEATFEAVDQAAVAYGKALETGDPTPWMGGRSVKPVFRTFA
jgi:glutamate-1-semialdehyde 2,1-aminomutase